MFLKSFAQRAVLNLFRSGYVKRPYYMGQLVNAALNSNPHRIKRVEIELASNSPLGCAGDIIAMPMDNTISRVVMRTGAWEPEVVGQILRYADRTKTYDLIDVGANCGLFSRQLLLSDVQIGQVLAVEIDPDISICLAKNLARFPRVIIETVGLGERDGNVDLFKDALNHGNNSLLRSAMEDYAHSSRSATVVETGKFFADRMECFTNPLIWKSDTQGYDEVIVSRVPMGLWSRVDIGLMELTRVTKPAFDMAALKERLSQFGKLMSGEDRLTVDQALEYASGTDGAHIDLMMIR
jgi:FkbM family methyltransferase